MKDQTSRRRLRGAIYTRVSTDQGLEHDFNSLDAQREACEAYIKSQHVLCLARRMRQLAICMRRPATSNDRIAAAHAAWYSTRV
jgi:hypothetical protein